MGLSLPVRMALLRLLSNHRVMGSGMLRPSQAWGAVRCGAVQRLIDDPRVSFVDSLPSTHAGSWLGNVARREPTPDLWTDAWLAAVAQAQDWEMTTFNRGFRAFAKLKLHLLDPAG